MFAKSQHYRMYINSLCTKMSIVICNAHIYTYECAPAEFSVYFSQMFPLICSCLKIIFLFLFLFFFLFSFAPMPIANTNGFLNSIKSIYFSLCNTHGLSAICVCVFFLFISLSSLHFISCICRNSEKLKMKLKQTAALLANVQRKKRNISYTYYLR